MSETTHKCSERVYDPRHFRRHQCTIAAKVERGGKWYCKRHDPEAVAKRRQEQEKKWREKWDREAEESKRERDAAAEQKRERDSAAEQKRRADAFPDLMEALEPFAHFAEAVVRFAESNGNFPKYGPIYALHGHGLDERQITVEHFRAALSAIAKARGEA